MERVRAAGLFLFFQSRQIYDTLPDSIHICRKAVLRTHVFHTFFQRCSHSIVYQIPIVLIKLKKAFLPQQSAGKNAFQKLPSCDNTLTAELSYPDMEFLAICYVKTWLETMDIFL